jgi:hypothetical protein
MKNNKFNNKFLYYLNRILYYFNLNSYPQYKHLNKNPLNNSIINFLKPNTSNNRIYNINNNNFFKKNKKMIQMQLPLINRKIKTLKMKIKDTIKLILQVDAFLLIIIKLMLDIMK